MVSRIVAPDAGRVKVAERYSEHLGADLALVHKIRPKGTTNQVEARRVGGHSWVAYGWDGRR